jgi:hypothetical protein
MKILSLSSIIALCTPASCFFCGSLVDTPSRCSQLYQVMEVCRAPKCTLASTLKSSVDLNGKNSQSHPDRSWSRRESSYIAVLTAASFLLPKPASSDAPNPEAESLFYSRWQYARPADILPFIFTTAKKGDIDGILAAMDEVSREQHHLPHCVGSQHLPVWNTLSNVQVGRRKRENTGRGALKTTVSAKG